MVWNRYLFSGCDGAVRMNDIRRCYQFHIVFLISPFLNLVTNIGILAGPYTNHLGPSDESEVEEGPYRHFLLSGFYVFIHQPA